MEHTQHVCIYTYKREKDAYWHGFRSRSAVPATYCQMVKAVHKLPRVKGEIGWTSHASIKRNVGNYTIEAALPVEEPGPV